MARPRPPRPRPFSRSKGGVAMAAAGGATAGSTPTGLLGWLALLWPFPAVVSSTFMIAWASEVASFFVSRGMALAVLALLQVLPEFAVEAILARDAALDPNKLALVTANFTGANRILVGLALPLIFFITAWVYKKRGQKMRDMVFGREHSVEVVFLLIPSIYSLIFWFRHSISLVDSFILIGMYVAYILVLYRLPTAGEEEKEELTGVPAKVMARSPRFQRFFAMASFVVGGTILFLTVEPFVHNMQLIAFALGLSAYLVLQYIAPILSEFPEFLTVTYWSRQGRGSIAFMNVVSAKINQWTLLIAMIPVVFVVVSVTHGTSVTALPLDPHQQVEVLLTAAQGLFAVACLLKLRLQLWEASALLFLWAFQAVDFLWDASLLAMGVPRPLGTTSVTREWVTLIYFALIAVQFLLYRREWVAFAAFREVWARYIRPPPPEKPAPAPSG